MNEDETIQFKLKIINWGQTFDLIVQILLRKSMSWTGMSVVTVYCGF